MLILQKIYFFIVLSYIIYFVFIISNYKYKIILPKYKAFTIIIIAVIISIFVLLCISNLDNPIVWWKGAWNNDDDNLNNYIGGKKKDLIIQEALHKTYKWKKYLNLIVKRLNEERALTYKESKEFIGFLYSSNTINGDDDTWRIVKTILNLNESNISVNPSQENIDNEKKKMLKRLVNSSVKTVEDSDDLKFFTIPANATEKRLKYFIEGYMPEFDKMFSIFGGQGIYKPLSLYGENNISIDINSINNGGKLKEPFTNSVESIKTWLPIRYEFYDDDFRHAQNIPDVSIPDDTKEGYKYFYVKYLTSTSDEGTRRDVVISDNVSGITQPQDIANKRTLPSLIQNNFETKYDATRSYLHKDGVGFINYPNWLKRLDLIKILKRRDLAKNIDRNNIKTNELIYPTTDKYKMFGLDPPLRPVTARAVTPRQPPVVIGGSNTSEPYGVYKKNVEKSGNSYNNLYDTIKDDIDIDLLKGDVGEVDTSKKEKYSLTNSKQQNSEGDKKKDYLKNFLNFIIYSGNVSFVVILSSLMLYLGSYKKKIIKQNTDISENDKNLFYDKITKHIKYSRILLLIFVLIFLFSFKEFKEYTFFLKKLLEKVKTKAKYSLIVVIIVLLVVYFLIISYFDNTNAQEKITNLFVKDLNRNSKFTKTGDRIDPSITDNNWICYSKTNQCTNRKDYIESYPNNRPFTSEQDCKNSGCEDIEIKNSGISAGKYNKINT